MYTKEYLIVLVSLILLPLAKTYIFHFFITLIMVTLLVNLFAVDYNIYYLDILDNRDKFKRTYRDKSKFVIAQL